MADNYSTYQQPASNQPNPPSAAKPGGEAEYLQQQADLAMRAMKKSMAEAKGKLAKGLSLNVIAKDHPWVTVAAGAAAGFATGVVITPNKRDAALKRLAEIERALHPLPPGVAHAATADGKGRASSSVSSSLLSAVFSLVKPVLLNGVTAMVAAQSAASSASEQTAETNAQATGAQANSI